MLYVRGHCEASEQIICTMVAATDLESGQMILTIIQGLLREQRPCVAVALLIRVCFVSLSSSHVALT